MRNVPGILLLVALAGCGGNPAAPAPRTFDLGFAAPRATLPALRVTSLRAVVPFDGVQMHYRLAWRNPSELADYAHSRWAAPPAELIRKQLLRAVSEGVAKCGLEIELQEFTQVFASKEASEARIELRGTLVGANGRVSSRGWNIGDADAGADAASGATSFARAADKAVIELAGWISAQPECR